MIFKDGIPKDTALFSRKFRLERLKNRHPKNSGDSDIDRLSNQTARRGLFLPFPVSMPG